jgi:hypothetical protein
MKMPALFFFSIMLAGSLSHPRQAQATLGEGTASIARDRTALSAARKATTSHPGYTVQEVASDATTVREYLNSAGVVFAVAWNGMVHPDLTTLLGGYASEYQNAKRQIQRQHGQKRSKVEANRVIVETWGHMRNLRGRAYLPSLMPKGVSVDEIN